MVKQRTDRPSALLPNTLQSTSLYFTLSLKDLASKTSLPLKFMPHTKTSTNKQDKNDISQNYSPKFAISLWRSHLSCKSFQYGLSFCQRKTKIIRPRTMNQP